MGSSHLWRRWRVVVGIAVLCGLTCGCAARSGLETDPEARDRQINAEVLRVIGELDGVIIEDVRVETRDGVVVLSGVQPSPDSVRDILRRVARVRGVTEVVNRIRIVRAPGAQDLWSAPA